MLPLNCGECSVRGGCIGICMRTVRDPRPEPPPADYSAPSLRVREGGDHGTPYDEAAARREARRREAAEVQALMDRLKTLRERVPVTYQKWDYVRTVEFKAVCQKAGHALKSAKPSKENLGKLIKELEAFHRG